jgi:hypothetical protein
MTDEQLQKGTNLQRAIRETRKAKTLWAEAERVLDVTLSVAKYEETTNVNCFENFEKVRELALEYLDKQLDKLETEFEQL